MSRWPIYHLRCRSAIHFLFNFSDIKTKKLRESQREKERNTLREGRREHRAAITEHRSRGRAICVLQSTIYDEEWPGEQQWRRRASYGYDDGDVTVRGLLGLVLVCVLGFFFFFFCFDKHLYVWFVGAVFGLLEFFVFSLLLYWGLISLPAMMRRDGFNFWFSVFFFLVENLWACRERATCNGLAVGFAGHGLR